MKKMSPKICTYISFECPILHREQVETFNENENFNILYMYYDENRDIRLSKA